jgi:hypothetical protein
MDIRTELALIPALRIGRYKKYNLVDILLLCIIATVCGVESVKISSFSVKLTSNGCGSICTYPTGYPAPIRFCGSWAG